VRPGGRLAYITCSIFQEENGDQASAFLARSPQFRSMHHVALWRRHFPVAQEEPRMDGGITLTPATTGTDGFYVVCFQRGEG
jgi:16S rRNA (cytosine967-C5)-methyltransferase